MDANDFARRLAAPVFENSDIAVWHLLAGCWGLVVAIGIFAYLQSRRNRITRVTTKSGLYLKDYGTH